MRLLRIDWWRKAPPYLVLALSALVVSNVVVVEATFASEPLDALVEIKVRARSVDLLYPWRRDGVEVSTGSGAIIKGGRILTAAHVIEDHVAIEVRRKGGTQWFDAEVEHVSDQVDLALLRVPEPSFFKGVKPLTIGPMPKVRDQVQVLGFPEGGAGAAVTRGIVSRVEVGEYVQSGESLLLVQIDAAINSGSSGGPVVSKNKLVGVALQTKNDAENVGYVAPALIVRHFLRDVEDGKVDGVPRSGIWVQLVQSDAHRRALGLSSQDGGILVVHVDAGSEASKKLRPGDVLIEVDGKSVASDGTIEVRGIGRLPADYAFQAKDVGDQVGLTVLRDQKIIRMDLRTSSYEMLIPQQFFGHDDPPYFVFAGIVFQPLTSQYFELFTDGIPTANLGAAAHVPHRTDDRREVVVVTSILESRLNSTYRWAEDEIVRTAEGVRVRDLPHLAALLDGAKGPYVDITLQNSKHLVFDLEEARAANRKILSEYDAESDRSLALIAPSKPILVVAE